MPFDDCLNDSYVDVLLKCVLSVALVLWGFGPIIRNEQKVCCITSGK